MKKSRTITAATLMMGASQSLFADATVSLYGAEPVDYNARQLTRPFPCTDES